MWFKTLLSGLFGSKKGDGIGGLATDIREAIKGKEIDPNTLIDTYVKIAEIQSKNLQTEMQGNWLQRSWRPILMLLIIIIIANNYILFPYFPNTLEVLELPDNLWTLLELGVGGYVVGRSVEKAVKVYKDK
jgi:hypothetical protein